MVMVVVFDLVSFSSVRMLLARIPETLGMLIFAIGLIGVAVFLRWYFSRETDEKNNASK